MINKVVLETIFIEKDYVSISGSAFITTVINGFVSVIKLSQAEYYHNSSNLEVH